ncbi:hypothetical protein VCSRO126_1719 [Vibrio cholerae]|nr:hypothetical protein VCSRO126_1719 [Vibrio cholerae]
MYVVVVLSLNTSFTVETLPPNLVSGIIKPLQKLMNNNYEEFLAERALLMKKVADKLCSGQIVEGKL